jgi:hypothetical protein
MVTRCVLELLNEGSNEISFGDLWERLLNVLGGEEVKPPHAITARAMETELFGTISKKDVSKILKEKLGMTRQRTTREGRTLILYKVNMAKLVRAAKKYLNALMPKMPQCLEGVALENRLEKPLEADFSGVS